MPYFLARRLPRSLILGGALALALSLGGCTATPSTAATATHSPIPPAATAQPFVLRTLTIPGFKVGQVIAGADGLALIAASSYPAGYAGAPALDYYRFSDASVTRVYTATTAPDGTPNAVVSVAFSGSRLLYETSASRVNDWVLWSYDVATGQRAQIVNSVQNLEADAFTWVAGPTGAVWTTVTSGGGPFQITYHLVEYNFGTGKMRTVSSNETAILKPLAMNSREVIFTQDDMTMATTVTLLQWLDQPAPFQISDGAVVTAVMTDTYAAWDDPHTRATSVYEVNTGQLHQNIARCMGPALDNTGPYVVCLSGSSILAIHLPDGAQRTLTGEAPSMGGVSVASGRVAFVGDGGSVRYFDLPAR